MINFFFCFFNDKYSTNITLSIQYVFLKKNFFRFSKLKKKEQRYGETFNQFLEIMSANEIKLFFERYDLNSISSKQKLIDTKIYIWYIWGIWYKFPEMVMGSFGVCQFWFKRV
jgi:hypothetical protein